jgi:hypothetical protein
MRHVMLLVTVGLVMAAMMLVMAMPAFAAKPTLLFGVGCGRGELVAFILADSGREFGQVNKLVMSDRSLVAWRGYECERFVP